MHSTQCHQLAPPVTFINSLEFLRITDKQSDKLTFSTKTNVPVSTLNTRQLFVFQLRSSYHSGRSRQTE